MISRDSQIVHAGFARADITPNPDCILDGFAGRDHGCEGIHDNLTVTVLALARGEDITIIAGMDLLELIDSQVDEIWRRLQNRFGIERHRVFLNCSHTHAGPMMRTRNNRKFCQGSDCHPDAEYVETVISRTVNAAAHAIDRLEPARLSYGLGETHIGINRRARDTSIYKNRPAGYTGFFANFPNPDKPVDRTCFVLNVSRPDGSPLGVVFTASCHPTTMSYDNYLVSAEYPGVARQYLEESMDGALTLFLQGIGGDVKPIQVAEKDSFRSGDYTDVEVVGKELAGDVERILKTAMNPLDVSVASAVSRIDLPFDNEWNVGAFDRYDSDGEPDYRRNWARRWKERLANGETTPQSLPLTLGLLELGNGIRLPMIAGEVLTDIGLKIKDSVDIGVTVPLGYTNGRVGYIPDSPVLREGGYEGVETVFFTESMPAPWREDIDETLLDAFAHLAKNLT